MFRSRNKDKEVLPAKKEENTLVLDDETDGRGAPGTVQSLQSDDGASPTYPRANEQSRSLEQVHGARMQQPSQIS